MATTSVMLDAVAVTIAGNSISLKPTSMLLNKVIIDVTKLPVVISIGATIMAAMLIRGINGHPVLVLVVSLLSTQLKPTSK